MTLIIKLIINFFFFKKLNSIVKPISSKTLAGAHQNINIDFSLLDFVRSEERVGFTLLRAVLIRPIVVRLFMQIIFSKKHVRHRLK